MPAVEYNDFRVLVQPSQARRARSAAGNTAYDYYSFSGHGFTRRTDSARVLPVVAGVLAGDQGSIQILPHESGGRFRGRAGENLNRHGLEQRMRARTHASRDDEVYSSFLQPRRQEPGLVLRSGHLGRCRRLLRNRIDVHQGKLLAVAEMLGKASAFNGMAIRI